MPLSRSAYSKDGGLKSSIKQNWAGEEGTSWIWSKAGLGWEGRDNETLSGFFPNTAFFALFISNSIFLLVHFSQYLSNLKAFRELEMLSQGLAVLSSFRCIF